jgi:crotonobetainyl-CoA:carnitine CoA-transferase CaiB-like acyl-CoA transferase
MDGYMTSTGRAPLTSRLLDGVRVVDFSHMLAGPSGTMALADLGASVVKVEDVAHGDATRTTGFNGAMFASFNRNKKSLAVDLKTPDGRTIADRLVSGADIVVESFRPGVMARLKLDYASVRVLNPNVIYASVVGFGSVGPAKDRAGIDLVIQAESGLMHLTGEPGARPLRAGFQAVDAIAGAFLAQAVLGALYHRERTGEGSQVEVRLIDSAMFLQAHQVTGYSMTGTMPGPTGNSVPHAAPSDLVRVGDGGYLMIAAYMEAQWEKLCDAIGQPDMVVDARFSSVSARREHRRELVARLEDALASYTTKEAYDYLLGKGLLVGKLRAYDEVLQDPQLVENGTFERLTLDDGRDIVTVRLPYRLSSSARRKSTPPPRLGSDSREVLSSLGYSDQDVAKFVQRGAVACAPSDEGPSQ